VWLSVAVHAAVGVIVVAAQFREPARAPQPRPHSRMVYTLSAADLVKLPPLALVTPRLAAPKPTPVPEAPKPEAPKPPPPAPVAAKPVEVLPVVPATARVEPVKPADVQRPLETGLFERTRSTATNQAAGDVTTGGFTTTTAARTTTAGTVTTGGFGTTAAARTATTGTVSTGGFGTTTAARTATPTGEAQTAGFDRQRSAPTQVAAAAMPTRKPVEITFKPTPEYTDEARSARVEGTVSLELEFTATGDVRVVRVVRGLGHGLDESAQRAALRIRFTPAQADGAPVDSRATVHITFRLS
jgi:TonB family protein